MPPEEGGGTVGEAQLISGSFNYGLAPGIAILGGITHHIIKDADYTATNFVGSDFGRMDNEATTYTLSTQVTF